MTLPPRLARLHSGARLHAGLARFALLNRILLATAFLPTGLVKLTGQRFTLLPLDNPVGFFFEAMYRTGPFWYFIGAIQVLAAAFLLVPSTATLGALLFLPIGVSILLITWGVGFTGTVWVAAGMVLSVIYLLCWDADRIWEAATTVVGRQPPERPQRPELRGMHAAERAGWLIGASALLGFFLITRGFVPRGLALPSIALGFGGGTLVIAGWVAGSRS